MVSINTPYLLAIFLPPLLNACLSLLNWKKERKELRNNTLILVSFLSMVIVLKIIFMSVVYNYNLDFSIGRINKNIEYLFSSTRYGLLFIFILSMIYPIANIYTLSYLDKTNDSLNKVFLFCYNMTIFAALGLGISGNLFVMLIFYELITATSYPLILYYQNKQSELASRTYLLYLIGSSVALLMPMAVITYVSAGTLDFQTGGILTNANLDKNMINILYLMAFFGIAKTAIFPVHRWLIKAMVAPAPVSAMLHSIAVVKSGLFALIMITYRIFGLTILKDSLWSIYDVNFIIIISSITIIYFSIRAYFIEDLKKRLAYSTINQIALSILMIGLLTDTGMRAAMIQFMSHSLAKFTLFSAIGAVYLTKKNYNLKNISDLWKNYPIVAIALTVGCLSIIGLPPTVGFYAKYEMINSAMSSNNYFVLVMLGLSTLLSFGYMFDVIYYLFFNKENIAEKKLQTEKVKLPFGIVFSLGIMIYFLLTMSKMINIITVLLTKAF